MLTAIFYTSELFRICNSIFKTRDLHFRFLQFDLQNMIANSIRNYRCIYEFTYCNSSLQPSKL